MLNIFCKFEKYRQKRAEAKQKQYEQELADEQAQNEQNLIKLKEACKIVTKSLKEIGFVFASRFTSDEETYIQATSVFANKCYVLTVYPAGGYSLKLIG